MGCWLQFHRPRVWHGPDGKGSMGNGSSFVRMSVLIVVVPVVADETDVDAN